MIKWVIPDRLARSSRPGYSPGHLPVARVKVDAWLDEVRNAGIKSIVCLLAQEHLGLYQDLPSGCSLTDYYRHQRFEVAHIAVLDHQQPPLSEEDLRCIAAAYERLPKPVLVHCSAGIDRTGRAVRHLLHAYHD